MSSTRGEQAIPNFAELQSGLPSARHMAPIEGRKIVVKKSPKELLLGAVLLNQLSGLPTAFQST